MKKTLLLIAGILVAGLVLKGSGVIDALIFFIIIGALPGTSLSLSPSMTVAILTTLIAMLIIYIAAPAGLANSQSALPPEKPTRRYSKI